MDRRAVLAAFSLPSLLAIYGVWTLAGSQGDGFADIANALSIFMAIVAATVAGAALFALRSRDLRWWQGILISFGSALVALGVLLLIGWIGHLSAPAPIGNT